MIWDLDAQHVLAWLQDCTFLGLVLGISMRYIASVRNRRR